MEDKELTSGTTSEDITNIPVIEEEITAEPVPLPEIDPGYFFAPYRHEGEEYDAYHWRRKLGNRLIKLGKRGRLEGQVVSFNDHLRMNAQKEV